MKPTCEELELQLEESRREFRSADATIHNLELKLTDMAVQLANAESKCRELAAAENNLIDSECHVAELEDALRDKQALIEAAENRIAELTGKPAEEYADDDELLFEIDFCDDLSTSIQVAQWLKELRIRRAAGIGVKGE